MAGYGEPNWVSTPQNNTAVVADANVDSSATAAPSGGAAAKVSSGKGGCLLCCLSLANMGLAAMMVTLGVLTIYQVHKTGVGDLSEPFLAFYMILFAVLLFIYELMWWTPFPKLNKDMRKNFGFLYGLRGKGLYLIFVGFLCFGLGKEAKVAALNYATGSAFLAGGLFHMFVIFFRPETAREYQPAGILIEEPTPENVV
eukprot:CAMPEP_0201123706 /NCGR_PEP_ID=MMETSP0850-20130426/9013_1 /ASSEMBLY_ACC=CAM_ASM_000622 /TAXON_ID=183588 /ORGANISM="Pseudo-nitzschia fraudulenta, Strain WWA7" /LENGTH=198 /DNA_ID=CAMNT_0047390765 /DNA_START=103 /DNA_END=699 /DNA_ORIENTATION=+